MKILIAGSSSGIGTELTKNFDKEGNFLYLTYRQNKNNIYKPKNAEYKCLQIDFLDEKMVDANFKYIDNLDIAINVLGNIDNSLIKNMKSSQWNDVINNNLNVIFYATRAEIQKMNQNSHIINISSVLGTTGIVGASNYVAAKGGVEAYTKSLAKETIKSKIFVNCIALGYFSIGLGLKLTPKIIELTKTKIPLGEFGNPNEVSKLVNYIISSRYLVGQIIHLNGGFRI